MTPSLMFQICNAMVLPQWLLMMAAPGWHVTTWLVRSKLIPVLLAFVYLFYIVNLFSAGSFTSFNSLEGVKALFGKDELILAGWVHYLVFDLFVGSWVLQNARGRHVPHFWVVPALLLCFLMGPLGMLFYLGVRIMYPPQIQAVL